jgi:hypothetical protein
VWSHIKASETDGFGVCVCVCVCVCIMLLVTGVYRVCPPCLCVWAGRACLCVWVCECVRESRVCQPVREEVGSEGISHSAGFCLAQPDGCLRLSSLCWVEGASAESHTFSR